MTYYLKLDDDYLILDSHSRIQVVYPARTTSHPTQSKQTQSDNYVLDNAKASIVGVVSDVQSATPQNTRGAGGYVDKLLEFRDRGLPLAFKHRLDREEEDNWLITSFTPSQNNVRGYGATSKDGSIIQSFDININLERITPAKGVSLVVSVPRAYIDGLQVEGKGNASTNSLSETEEDSTINKYTAKREAAERNLASSLTGGGDD